MVQIGGTIVCIQTIFEIIGEGLFFFIAMVVFVLIGIALIGPLFGLLMIIAYIIAGIFLIMVNPLTWIVLIIIAILVLALSK